MNIPVLPHVSSRRILIVDEGELEVGSLRSKLQKAGFDAVLANGDDEISLVETAEQSDFIVLISAVSPRSSISTCRRLRANPRIRSVPIIIVSAKSDESDRIRGLEAGADDYMVKPFSPDELIARVRAVLRRTFPLAREEQIVAGEVVMNLITHRVTFRGRPVHLPPIQFKLLQQFMERPGEAITRKQLLEAVWGASIHVELRTVDVHVRRIRAVLSEHGSPNLIRTVYTVGYALNVDEENPMPRPMAEETAAAEAQV